uniref:Uncharacterized protein n=1 Tax=Romanomermis culicivorax TaxID=13658 RepID=A0A915IEZ7_ROMCU
MIKNRDLNSEKFTESNIHRLTSEHSIIAFKFGSIEEADAENVSDDFLLIKNDQGIFDIAHQNFTSTIFEKV